MGGMLRAGMGVVVVVPSEAAVTPPSKERADVLLRVFLFVRQSRREG